MHSNINRFLQQANTSILGKEKEIKLALTCLIAQGHLLIEDIPGVGKTTFAKTLSKLSGLSFSRIQFTNDLLPSDLLGVQIYSQKDENFQTIKGPIFHHFIMADELNRASAKTQSALLEAMEENQVTIDGKTFKLPKPFFVVATQNPRSSVGTNLLPESQLDRFMMKMKIGYPDSSTELKMLSSDQHIHSLDKLEAVFSDTTILEIFNNVNKIKISETLLQYILSILETSRSNEKFKGLSPRAGRDLIKAIKAWAYINERDFCIPDDVKELAPYVFSHRLAPMLGLSITEETKLTLDLIKMIPVDN